MIASAQAVQALKPERLMGGTRLADSEHRAIVMLLTWMGLANRADQSHPRVRRWGLPVICAGLGLPSLLNPYEGSKGGLPTGLALTAAYTLPLLWRGQRPMLVFALTTGASMAALATGVLTGADFARIVALHNVGRFGTPGQLMAAFAVTIAQASMAVLVYSAGGQLAYVTRAPVLIFLMVISVLAIAALGLAGRLGNAYIVALQQHAVRLEVERDQRTRLAAAAERARVAREMHDILGHTLAVIVGLADGASRIAERSPQRGAYALTTIAESGRGALGELRRLLAVVGDEPDRPDALPLAPQPGLADLAGLLERVRAAGPTVTLNIEGDLTRLSQGFQLAVYRIVQEALTNVLKHAAPDTTVDVAVQADDDVVRLTVEDTGPSRTPQQTLQDDAGGGHGLVGMRERAALYQGGVAASPNTHGGWTVRARLIPQPSPVSPGRSTLSEQGDPTIVTESRPE